MKKLLLIIGILFIASTHQALAYSFSRSITVDHTLVPNTDQSSFPMLVSGTYSYLATVANGGLVQNASGFDVGFYTSATCASGKLNWETEKYVASTGEVDYWVNIATLSHTTDTVIYLCYDDGTISSDQSNHTAVWNSNFAGVYHFPNGTSLTTNDSTSNALNGTPTNTPTATTGQIDGAMNVVSASNQYSDLGTTFDPSAVTYTAWVNGTSFPNSYNAVIAHVQSTNDYSFLLVKSTGKLNAEVKTTSGDLAYDGTGINTLSTGTWYFIALTYDNVNGLKGYFNGTLDGSKSPSGNLSTGFAASTLIGKYPSGTFNFNGAIDETRMSNVARSADWIATEYNTSFIPDKSASSTQGFYTMGSQSSTGGGGIVSAFAKITLFARMFIGNAKIRI